LAALDDHDAGLQRELMERGNLPRHLAIIMDGNGRWAYQRGLPRIEGHRAAREVVRDTVRACGKLGISVLTLYAFSGENWQRPWGEVLGLMRLLRICLIEEVPELDQNNVRLQTIGQVYRLPRPCQKALFQAIDLTSKNTGLILNLALSYGGRAEIADAARRIATDVERGLLRSDAVDEACFAQYLYNSDLPDPDLVIRTSGEMRISNFLLWQIAYAEFHVTPVLWPDFRRKHLYEAIRNYQHRERRFGRTGTQVRTVQQVFLGK
jgi:undecaprenyl diphosphate synthase